MCGSQNGRNIEVMRTFATTLSAVVIGLLLAAGPASARWSAPQTIRTHGYPVVSAVAVDARGDAAVAWVESANGPYTPHESVHLLLRTHGQLHSRVVWSSTHARLGGLTVAIGRGEVTVAWAFADTLRSDPWQSVDAAYGPLNGSWFAARAVGRLTEFSAFVPGWQPRLAEAPAGSVLLAWDTWNANHGIHVAWRTPGHPFASGQGIANAPRGAAPQFDAAGNAYLASNCSATVLVARARSHHFTRDVLATSSAVGFELSLSGAGRGIAAWVKGTCSTGGAAIEYGPVFARVLRGGVFGPRLALTPAHAQDHAGNVVSLPTGGSVTWASQAPAGTQPTFFNGMVEFGVRIDAHGLAAAPQPITADQPLVADGGGDVLYTPDLLLTGGTPMFIRPAGGGADQPLPTPQNGSGLVGVATAAFGRAAAVAWNPDYQHDPPSTLALSVWQP
jgi:hypothetical protein